MGGWEVEVLWGANSTTRVRALTGERGCIRKPKHEQQREAGEYGYGGYKDEPWSMQALEKRIYAVRDFYKNTLKGLERENPGEAQSVCDALSMLRLIVGYKPQHVPKVSWGWWDCIRLGVGHTELPRAVAG